MLSQFNNEPLEAVNDSIVIGADSTLSILFLGNSLTYTGVPEEEADKEKRGLTSTKKEYDYVHRLVKMISNNDKVNVRYSVVNISGFERTFTSRGFEKEMLGNVSNITPDYLIIQIGENVAREDINSNHLRYKKELIELLSLFPSSKIIITLPFWPYNEVNYAHTDVAMDLGALIVDLSHLGNGTDKENFASSQRSYKQSGVGEHPGDRGMERIADCLYVGYKALKD